MPINYCIVTKISNCIATLNLLIVCIFRTIVVNSSLRIQYGGPTMAVVLIKGKKKSQAKKAFR